MKVRWLERLACPACHGRLRLEDGLMEGLEVWAGALICGGCVRRFPVTEGIPRLLEGDAVDASVTSRTAARYGHLWSRSKVQAGRAPSTYHFEQMAGRLSLPPLQGLVLDAGCGEGIDLANQARGSRVELIGVELSEGGCRTSFERTRRLANAAVLQGDLRRLPFADGTFDFIYSYGVLHHLSEPADGLRELVRVLKPGSRIAVYLYEDFRDQPLCWRGLLAAANACRPMTTALPPAVLYRLCQAGSPIMYALFTVPHRILTQIPGCRSFAATIPFRHGGGPFSLVGDLYDRFSAPIERRYTRADALALFGQAGLRDILLVNDRGWVMAGSKPPRGHAASAHEQEPAGELSGVLRGSHGA